MKNTIPLIALSAFMVLILLGFDFMTKPAFAISASDFTFGAINTEIFYQESIATYVVLQKSTSPQASANVCFLDSQSESPSTEQVCMSIFPQQGGCDVSTIDPVNYNPCSATAGTTDCDTDFPDSDPCSNKTGLTGVFEGLWCGTTYCFILFDYDTGSWSSQLIRFWSLGVGSSQTGDISGYRNITNTWLLQPAMWGYDECNPAPPNCGLGGITIFWAHTTALANTVQMNREGGTSLMGTTGSADTFICINIACNGVFAGEIANIDGCRHCGGATGITRVMISEPNSSSATQRVAVIMSETLATLSAHNDDNLSTNCGGTVTGVATNTGYSSYLGGDTNRFILNTDSGLITMSVNGSIAVANCYPDAGLPFIDFIRAITFDADNDIWYVWHGSGQPLASVTAMNLSATTTVLDNTVDFDPNDLTIGHTISGWVDGGQPYNSMAVGYEFNTLLITTDSAKARLFYLEGFEEDTPTGGGGQSGGTCLNVDTNGDGKSGTVLDCVGQSTSPFDGITGGQNATDITATLTDGIGLTNCGENPDHETCGSGLFLFLMLLLLSEFLALAGYLGFTRITNAEAHIMDVGLLVLIIGFVDLSIAFYLNWIPDIVFYSIVTIIAGFLAFGLFSRLRGG